MNDVAFFVSDLHGRSERYRKLWAAIRSDRPTAVYLGGDLLPSAWIAPGAPEPSALEFLPAVLAAGFRDLRSELGSAYPSVLLILGNDDLRAAEEVVLAGESEGLWTYLHNRSTRLGGRPVYGYSCIPPTPFLGKDWERYDVGRHLPPGAVSPEEGIRSVPEEAHRIRWATISEDLENLAGTESVEDAIFLFHSPPHDTRLDRAALDGRSIDHVPLDVHVGSVAIRRFIETRQPHLTLHGHVHESARLTGAWRDRLGKTHLFSAAHDGPELALVRFRPDDPEGAQRSLI